MDNYKQIASEKFIELFGRQWVLNNAGNISSNLQDMGDSVKIAFIQNNYLPSEEEIIKGNYIESQAGGRIAFLVDKKTNICSVLFNNIIVYPQKES